MQASGRLLHIHVLVLPLAAIDDVAQDQPTVGHVVALADPKLVAVKSAVGGDPEARELQAAFCVCVL